MKCQKVECKREATTIAKVWLTDGKKRTGAIMGLATCDDDKPPIEHLVDRAHWEQWRRVAAVNGVDPVFELTTVEHLPIESDEAKLFFRMQAQIKGN